VPDLPPYSRDYGAAYLIRVLQDAQVDVVPGVTTQLADAVVSFLDELEIELEGCFFNTPALLDASLPKMKGREEVRR
jgi:hypothetical protein